MYCAHPECKRHFLTQEQLTNHEHQHARNPNFIEIYYLDPEGKVDRRKMIYRNIPTREITHVRKLIRYKTEKEQWECEICNKTALLQDKRNLIQHAIKAHKLQNKTTYKKSTLAQTEQMIAKTRIRPAGQSQNEEMQQNINTEETAETPITKENHTTQKNQDRKQHNATFWKRIGLIEEKEQEGIKKWKCQIPNCTKKATKQGAIVQHISKQHQQNILASNQGEICPFCNKRYTNLEPMIIHLELKTGAKKWQPCQCPLKHTKLEDKQTWRIIYQINKNRK